MDKPDKENLVSEPVAAPKPPPPMPTNLPAPSTAPGKNNLLAALRDPSLMAQLKHVTMDDMAKPEAEVSELCVRSGLTLIGWHAERSSQSINGKEG